MRSTRSESKAGSRRRWSVLEAEGMFGEYEKSGLTQRVFAREIGIGVSTLQYWRRRKARRRPRSARGETCSSGEDSREVALLEVDVEGIPGGGRAGEERDEIEWGDGLRLRVPRGFGKEELRALLELVKESR